MRDWLRQRRKEKGLTLVQLSKIVKISQPYLTQFELGNRTPRPEQAQALARVLGGFDWTDFYPIDTSTR